MGKHRKNKLQNSKVSSTNVQACSAPSKAERDVLKFLKPVKPNLKKSSNKRNKLKVRRDNLMKKFELLKAENLRKAKKKRLGVGELSSLRDALPPLSTLLENRPNIAHRSSAKEKGIPKAPKQRKMHLEGIKTIQTILKDKTFKKSPRDVVQQHIRQVLAAGK